MFISNAYAAGAPGAPDLMSFLPIIVIFILFWFMLIRPQMKQAKELKEMIAAIQKGDEVATTGGLVGRVVKITDSFVTIEIAVNTVVHVQKHAIQTQLPKGTLKTL